MASLKSLRVLLLILMTCYPLLALLLVGMRYQRSPSTLHEPVSASEHALQALEHTLTDEAYVMIRVRDELVAQRLVLSQSVELVASVLSDVERMVPKKRAEPVPLPLLPETAERGEWMWGAQNAHDDAVAQYFAKHCSQAGVEKREGRVRERSECHLETQREAIKAHVNARGHRNKNAEACWPSLHACPKGELFSSMEANSLLEQEHGPTPLELAVAQQTKFQCGGVFVEVYAGDGDVAVREASIVWDITSSLGPASPSASASFQTHTSWLERELGWRGLLIEYDTSRYHRLAQLRPYADVMRSTITNSSHPLKVVRMSTSTDEVLPKHQSLVWEQSWTSSRRSFAERTIQALEQGASCSWTTSASISLEEAAIEAALAHVDVLVVNAMGFELEVVQPLATSPHTTLSHVFAVDPEWRNELSEGMKALGFAPSYLMRRDSSAYSRNLT